ncbi:hypothetical protein MRX96_037316 [Rhipicephalus microplus]
MRTVNGDREAVGRVPPVRFLIHDSGRAGCPPNTWGVCPSSGCVLVRRPVWTGEASAGINGRCGRIGLWCVHARSTHCVVGNAVFYRATSSTSTARRVGDRALSSYLYAVTP